MFAIGVKVPDAVNVCSTYLVDTPPTVKETVAGLGVAYIGCGTDTDRAVVDFMVVSLATATNID